MFREFLQTQDLQALPLTLLVFFSVLFPVLACRLYTRAVREDNRAASLLPLMEDHHVSKAE